MLDELDDEKVVAGVFVVELVVGEEVELGVGVSVVEVLVGV